MDTLLAEPAIATTDPLVFLPAHQLAAMIRTGQSSATEVLEAHLGQIARRNPGLNAIVTLADEPARQRAKDADQALARGEVWGPLHGVPITIKDALETKGLRTTSSFKPLTHYVPQRDATAVERLRSAGAIILGKTNMPMLAMDGQSRSPLFGTANNPWDERRTPGGSTGGGAAAVAAGLSPLEIGSDIAGSVRIPAHFCGVFSLKPTEHRVSTFGHIPEPPGQPRAVRHMGCVGPLARSVKDLRLALELLQGPDGRQWEVPPTVPEVVSDKDWAMCRVAWSDDFNGLPVTADTRAALANLASELASRGCRVERCNPPDFDFALAWEMWGEIFGAESGASMPGPVRLIEQLRRGLAVTPTERGFRRGLALSMPRNARALTERDHLIGALESFLEQWDFWFCPVTAGPAFTHRPEGTAIEVDSQRVPYQAGLIGHTCPFNLTGHPVVVMPLAQSGQGLPIGVQLVGRRWHDMALLNMAQRVSEVTGPFRAPPG